MMARMKEQPHDAQSGDEETARRHDEGVKRTLAAPPQPRTAKAAKGSPNSKRSEVKDSHDR
jgi:hypothetical protein